MERLGRQPSSHQQQSFAVEVYFPSRVAQLRKKTWENIIKISATS